MGATLKSNESSAAGETETGEGAFQEPVVERTDERRLPTMAVADNRNEGGLTPPEELIDVIRRQSISGGETYTLDIW
jgi:hypothetical protein